MQVLNGIGANATTIQTEVTLGTTDDASVEVISGVTAGQKLKIQTTTSTGATTRTSTSGFGGGM